MPGEYQRIRHVFGHLFPVCFTIFEGSLERLSAQGRKYFSTCTMTVYNIFSIHRSGFTMIPRRRTFKLYDLLILHWFCSFFLFLIFLLFFSFRAAGVSTRSFFPSDYIDFLFRFWTFCGLALCLFSLFGCFFFCLPQAYAW